MTSCFQNIIVKWTPPSKPGNLRKSTFSNSQTPEKNEKSKTLQMSPMFFYDLMLIFHCPQKSQILQLKVQTSQFTETPAEVLVFYCDIVTQTFICTSRKTVELYLFTPPRRLPPHICSEQCKPGLPPPSHPDSSPSRKFDYRPRKESGAAADLPIGPKYLLTKKMPIALVLMENSFATPVSKCCASSQISC